ncbi:hypothetical protein GCM10010140_64210 [Streptosporangium pseudovulgare]|uniref:Uncharacterized protein n=1 Tax=Streptosporangium pseudovulgare TaxID=35765 RepID=A0ABQ2RGN3_9ACTN|nr:hypothetical protein GCM10010140_64210 [Streptosporangium pseudovulgare]
MRPAIRRPWRKSPREVVRGCGGEDARKRRRDAIGRGRWGEDVRKRRKDAIGGGEGGEGDGPQRRKGRPEGP